MLMRVKQPATFSASRRWPRECVRLNCGFDRCLIGTLDIVTVVSEYIHVVTRSSRAEGPQSACHCSWQGRSCSSDRRERSLLVAVTFLHYYGCGAAVDLARGVRIAVDLLGTIARAR